MRNQGCWAKRASALGCVVVLSGCSLFRLSPQEKASTIEPVLAAAGFRMLPADTPEKLEHLRKLPALKLLPRTRGGKLRYGYADPYVCMCMYVGDEQAYQRYQQLALEQQIADEQQAAAMMNEETEMDWEMDDWADPFAW
jgi:hypothetical protein